MPIILPPASVALQRESFCRAAGVVGGAEQGGRGRVVPGKVSGKERLGERGGVEVIFK